MVGHGCSQCWGDVEMRQLVEAAGVGALRCDWTQILAILNTYAKAAKAILTAWAAFSV